MKLSKTDFLIYRECAHNAWVKLHRPDVYHAKPLSEFDQTLLETGNEVDVLARDLFPGGVLVARGDVAESARLVLERTPVLYQPVFETDQFTTACDVLVWNGGRGAYDLFEVKASTNGNDKKAKEELYAYDIAFQAEVLRANGVPLGTTNLVRLNGEYERGAGLDINELFTREDFTARVAAVHGELLSEMRTAHAILTNDAPPAPPCECMYAGRSAHCTTFGYINREVPEYSVHDITRIGASKKKLIDLVDRGILAIEDVPLDVELSDAQLNQVRAAKLGHTLIDGVAIKEILESFAYPIAFLDYETFACAIPKWMGYHPFDHIPFQFSLDVIAAPGAEVVHHEFLHTEDSCPDAHLIDALRAALPGMGSIVTWNQSFEKGVNEKLAKRNPDARAFFADVNARVVDLRDVFTKQLYVHRGFLGRTSIKNILPVLVPSLSYKDLAIQEGATATAKWNEIVNGGISADQIVVARTDLLRYCALDTRAMVEIWRVLLKEGQCG